MINKLKLLDQFLQHCLLRKHYPAGEAVSCLIEAIEYSVLGGGKRFRPQLGFSLADSFGVHTEKVIPFLAAIEMIHSYSLIHDDLPCLDNDQERRGKATTHVAFGEGLALLSGDALLTEAFYLVAKGYEADPQTAVSLTLLLAQNSGLRGMISGQALDIAAKKTQQSLEELRQMQMLKTGALIAATCTGIGFIAQFNQEQLKTCSQFGQSIGFAFQLADDLLDSKNEIEAGSFPALIGMPKTFELLQQASQKAKEDLFALGITAGLPIDMIEFNLSRMK